MSETRRCPVCQKPIPEDRGPAAKYCCVLCRDKAVRRRNKARRNGEDPGTDVPGLDLEVPEEGQAPFIWRLKDAPSVLEALEDTLDRMDLQYDPLNRTRIAIAKGLAAALDDGLVVGALPNHGAAIAATSKELRAVLVELEGDKPETAEFEKMLKDLSSAGEDTNSKPDTQW